MTRILVYGTVDDTDYVCRKLDEIDRIYGPITHVIHMNHLQALDWMKGRDIRQVPVLENWPRYGLAAPDRARDALFAARPDYVIMFEMPERRETAAERKERLDPTRKKSKVELITLRALSNGLQVITYTYEKPVKVNIGKTVAQPAAYASA